MKVRGGSTSRAAEKTAFTTKGQQNKSEISRLSFKYFSKKLWGNHY